MKSAVHELLEILSEPEKVALEGPRLMRLASGHSTSIRVLSVLLTMCPELVLQNPAFRLAMATDPSLVSRLSGREQAAIAGCAVADPAMIRALGARRTRPLRCRVAAAGNPSCPPDMLRGFLKHRCEVRCALARNPSIPEDLVEDLSVDDLWKVREQVALRPTLSRDLFERMAVDDSWHVRQSIARNPSLPDALKDALVYDPYYLVREALADRSDIGEDRLAVMAQREKGFTVLCAVILNPSTPLSGLEAHHGTDDYRVEDALAEAYRRRQGSPGAHYRAARRKP